MNVQGPPLLAQKGMTSQQWLTLFFILAVLFVITAVIVSLMTGLPLIPDGIIEKFQEMWNNMFPKLGGL